MYGNRSHSVTVSRHIDADRIERGMLQWSCFAGISVETTSISPVALVFDGDDTLWSTEPLYDRARQRAREEVVRAGLDGAEWEDLERRIDVENVRHLGFSVERFPTSCAQAYEAVARANNSPASPAVIERVRAAAQTVFGEDPPLVPGARELLEGLRAQGAKLALLTKGDHDLQLRRVKHSGLADLFDVIQIVEEKPPTAFREIITQLQTEPENTWSVGNSVRSDILPAIEAGLRAIWIDAHVWEHERFSETFSHPRVLVVKSLTQVTALLKRS